jgi:hypothetical protein
MRKASAPFAGSQGFVLGANLPWIGYGTDVGASVWFPDGGLSARSAARERLDRALATLAADGVSIVRAFLMCDLRSGVCFDADGVPRSLDASVFPDMDAWLESARGHGIRLMPVLLDFHLCAPSRMVSGVQVGGRSRLLADPAARKALVELVIRPIVERYGRDEAIVAWDVMNEPEWCVERGPLPRRCRVSVDALRDLLDQAVRCLRQFAEQPVTVGCAGTTRLDLVLPLDLDFYQVHWYERFGWAALERPVSDLGLGGRPVILGEFPGRSPFVADVLDRAKRAGYGGAFVWSLLAEDDESGYPARVFNGA